MAFGFFGGFILGFLGTALPRMLGSAKLTWIELGLLFAIHLAMVAALALACIPTGDWLALALWILVLICLGRRFFQRTDVPPPGFVLVALSLLCAIMGTALALIQNRLEDQYFWISLRPLLQFQAFILLPILGVGGFFLPRFFNLASRQDFAESRSPLPDWTRQMLLALVTGLLICGTFIWEAAGHGRLASAVRSVLSVVYLYWQVPFYRSKIRGSSLAMALRVAFLLLPAGLMSAAMLPAFRVAWLHLTLIGGFSIFTLCVATRVVFGHSGLQRLLSGRLRWFTIAVFLMLAGMVTRISGDFSTRILPSHYSYGGLMWATGLLIWGAAVLPSIRFSDPD